ncbi:LacI family DNA-binding transcriptional regulator [Puniceicoccus vermicola]|uniref:LacI family DNA-binding transcriptional regulator n=1 Tax=Puniceicoccus vermicola TaxID=388746 RepID=A0A7X1E518_9BACT|nr:LacI family DNA-binding transcriptional regulator [Puniceicoccus vermicola]MBC2602706.1 LacI family DNA-binding transcriptional regulator [Puniceicoccus vermicola]
MPHSKFSPGAQNIPTMKDVAKAVGVHQTTVSRALRNASSVSPAMREKIRETADRMGYRTNPLLSALGTLRRKRADTLYETPIAYLLHESQASARHLKGAQDAARQRGFKIDLFHYSDSASVQRINRILTARNILGIIIGPLPQAHGHFQLDWERFCTVVIEYSFNEPRFDRVVTDSYRTMLMAVEHCLEHGYQRIGLVLSKVVDDRNEGLLSAAYWREQMRWRSMTGLPILILEEWNENKFEKWMKKASPEVIVTSNTLIYDISGWLKQNRYHVPKNMGLLNLNVANNRIYSGICQDSPAIGATAAALLIEKLNHNDSGIPVRRKTILTDGIWQDGRTLRHLDGASKVRKK